MNIYNWEAQEEKKTICSYLKNNEKISHSDWIIDISYFYNETSFKIKSGYGVWSKPVLKIIKNNKMMERVVTCCSQWLIEDIKYKKKINNKIHKRGFILRHCFFNPISWLLGSLACVFLRSRDTKHMSTTVR